MNREVLEQQRIHRFGEPTEDVVALIERSGLNLKWYAIPQLEGLPDGIEEVEIDELLKGLVGNPLLDGTLRTADMLNGCRWLCDTCLADAMPPTKWISRKSFAKASVDELFLRMLQPDSLRFGSSGDILNHPEGIGMVENALDASRRLGGDHHIKVMTNFRPKSVDGLDQLLVMAVAEPEKLELCISLPFNRTDEIQRRFAEYAMARKKIFGNWQYDGEFIDATNLTYWVRGATGNKNITIYDVRSADLIYRSGRVIEQPIRRKTKDKVIEVGGNGYTFVKQMGLCKTYLNADGLWLMVYATGYESHTTRLFTPITPDNLTVLSQIPYHPDFPTPPNWIGGRGQEKVVKKMLDRTGPMKELTYVR